MTVDSVVQVPICNPSGEQMDEPGEVHEPVDELAAEDGEAGVAAEGAAAATEEEVAAEGAAAATEGELATEGAAAATEGEAATAGAAADTEGAAAEGAAAGDDADAGAPEAPELPALEASVSEEAFEELPDAPHLGPVGGVKTSALLALAISTDAPGSGNLRSVLSAVVQSVTGMFAMNILGNEAVARSESSGIAYS